MDTFQKFTQKLAEQTDDALRGKNLDVLVVEDYDFTIQHYMADDIAVVVSADGKTERDDDEIGEITIYEAPKQHTPDDWTKLATIDVSWLYVRSGAIAHMIAGFAKRHLS